jgi:hypothetical protein
MSDTESGDDTVWYEDISLITPKDSVTCFVCPIHANPGCCSYSKCICEQRCKLGCVDGGATCVQHIAKNNCLTCGVLFDLKWGKFHCNECNLLNSKKECFTCHQMFVVGCIYWPFKSHGHCLKCMVTSPEITWGSDLDQAHATMHKLFIDRTLEKFEDHIVAMREKYKISRPLTECLVLATMGSQIAMMRYDVKSIRIHIMQLRWMRSGNASLCDHASVSCLLFMRTLPNDIRMKIMNLVEK